MEGSKRLQEKRNKMKQKEHTVTWQRQRLSSTDFTVLSSDTVTGSQKSDETESDHTPGSSGFNYEETVKNLNKWYRIGKLRSYTKYKNESEIGPLKIHFPAVPTNVLRHILL